MSLITMFLFALTLSLDAMAVSVTNGVCSSNFQRKHALWMGLYFGAFQFSMSFIGWFLGSNLLVYIQQFDHWIAFILLCFIGGRMVANALRAKEGPACPTAYSLTHPKLILQALATSIDALAVGVTISLYDVSILLAAGIIGVVAFVLSLLGGLLGARLGIFFRDKAELVGGLVLIGLGIKILLEHVLA